MILNKKLIQVMSYLMLGAMVITCLLSLLRPSLSFSTDFDSLIDSADSATQKVSDGVYKVAMTAGPLAIMICLVILFFSHDSRKVGLIVGICITIAIAWLVIMVVHSGWVKDFLQNISDSYFKGSGG